jgi:hypothetical protein
VSGNDEDEISRSEMEQEDDASARPISDRALAMFFIALAIALVLGYLLLSKLADMSQEEDCALAHRKTCGASALPSTRRIGDMFSRGDDRPTRIASVDAMRPLPQRERRTNYVVQPAKSQPPGGV